MCIKYEYIFRTRSILFRNYGYYLNGLISQFRHYDKQIVYSESYRVKYGTAMTLWANLCYDPLWTSNCEASIDEDLHTLSVLH